MKPILDCINIILGAPEGNGVEKYSPKRSRIINKIRKNAEGTVLSLTGGAFRSSCMAVIYHPY